MRGFGTRPSGDREREVSTTLQAIISLVLEGRTFEFRACKLVRTLLEMLGVSKHAEASLLWAVKVQVADADGGLM